MPYLNILSSRHILLKIAFLATISITSAKKLTSSIHQISRSHCKSLKMSTLSNLQFDNRNIRILPVDNSYDKSSRETPNKIFSLVNPTAVSNPKVCFSNLFRDIFYYLIFKTKI